MARYNLFTSIKKLVTRSLSLLRPKTGARSEKPSIQPTPPRPSIVYDQTRFDNTKIIKPSIPSEYEKLIDELKKQNEELKRQTEELKNEQAKLKEELNKMKDQPAPAVPESLDFGPDDLPYEVVENLPLSDKTDIDEIKDITFKDFGSDDSLNILLDFLKNTDLSGVSSDSPFFDMDPQKQKIILLDYVQFQHDSNPAHFYKGKKTLSLENVPIWGNEFDRYISNEMEFESITMNDSSQWEGIAELLDIDLLDY